MLPVCAEVRAATEMTDVLVHELSHVHRRDCAMNLLADFAAAIQWCNPMVHLAARRLRAESEHACDDAVLERGAAAEGYAQLLLTLAHRAHVGSGVPRAAS